ncbi:hypothetical protein [Sphingomonas bacterium]|uniref:hypothetical protein n=1 Tax=Sphingomonas bacterium TaxID=1895847 RepID=UPI0015756FC9|nr:hypothetical protein [Sphingomonas bacterium]
MDDRLRERIAQVLDRRCEISRLVGNDSPKATLAQAHIGFEDPSKLSSDQIQGLCHALILTYAQMGISAD